MCSIAGRTRFSCHFCFGFELKDLIRQNGFNRYRLERVSEESSWQPPALAGMPLIDNCRLKPIVNSKERRI